MLFSVFFFGGWEYTFGYLFMKALKFDKKFADVSISEKIQNFDDFSDFCSPEFDSFLRDLAISRLNIMNNILAFQKVK